VQLRVSDLQAAATALGRKLHLLYAASEQQFDSIFTSVAEQQIGALVVMDDPIFDSNVERLVRLANEHALPAIYQWRQFVEAGGLISYGPHISEGYRQVGLYVGRILKARSPPTFRFLQPTKLELIINLRPRRTLASIFLRSYLLVPTSLLNRASRARLLVPSQPSDRHYVAFWHKASVAQCSAMSGAGAKPTLPVARPDFSL